MIKIEIVGNVMCAKGSGWKYERIGKLVNFENETLSEEDSFEISLRLSEIFTSAQEICSES